MRKILKAFEKGSKREISAAYWYVPVKRAGVFEGQPYDLVMTDISANHIALVEKGRSGKDVLVADSAEEIKKGTEQMKLEQIIEKGYWYFKERRSQRRRYQDYSEPF